MNAMVKAQSRKALKRGQGMTEYIIIVALIAIAAIGVVTLFGDNIRKLFGTSANALQGSANEKNDRQKANTGLTNKGMKNFGQNNSY
jgi:pilus assembly protein Flp/PilA